MSDDPIANMRARAVQCRRLAAAILDRKATEALRKMAVEIDTDIARLEAERAAFISRHKPPHPA